MRGEGTTLFWLLISLAAFVIAAFVVRSQSIRASREAANARKLQQETATVRNELMEAKKGFSQHLSERDFKIEGLTRIFAERKIQFPWLSTALADFSVLGTARDARMLETKKHPAMKAAEVVREHSKKRHEAERSHRIARYRNEYYEKLFPWIIEYVGDDVPDSAVDLSGADSDSDDDAAKLWLSKAEYDSLSSTEKYQKALDNWRKRKKSRWEVGREYERYVGYLYETMGYDVQFTGALEGFEDMGRDVIARRNSELVVIQCKYWSSEKIIHEKHIFQLFGSALEYAFRQGDLKSVKQQSLFESPIQTIGIKPILYTSTRLSEVARAVASILGVQFYENTKMADYPMIKCNISLRDSERIFHLPFDQKYDRVKLCNRGERCAYTVIEAEEAGFRRAWRWKPESTQ